MESYDHYKSRTEEVTERVTYVDRGEAKIHERPSHDEKVKGIPGITEIILYRGTLLEHFTKVILFSLP